MQMMTADDRRPDVGDEAEDGAKDESTDEGDGPAESIGAYGGTQQRANPNGQNLTGRVLAAGSRSCGRVRKEP